MSRIIYILLLFILPISLFSQNQEEQEGIAGGIYYTKEDYMQGKLSKPSEKYFMLRVGKSYTLTLTNDNSKETIKLKDSNIWGFKRGLTDYRVIDGIPHAIATRGEIWIYGSYLDGYYYNKKLADTIYSKTNNDYPYASKGIDGPLLLIKSAGDLYKLMDPKKAEEVKTAVKNFSVTYFLEDMADYYNSKRPGYLSTRYKYFFYEGRNRTANGKRQVTF